MRRLAGAAILLVLLACSRSGTRVPAPTTAGPADPEHRIPASTPARLQRSVLELGLARRVLEAGGCTVATVTSAGDALGRIALELRGRAGGWRATPWTANPRNGVASIRACPGWIEGPQRVRAIAEGVRHSRPAPLEVGPARWMRGLERSIGDEPVSVALVVDGTQLYGHDAFLPRPPASNEKLLLSLAALDQLGPRHRIHTVAAGRMTTKGVVRGDLWLIGHGDPELGSGRLRELAARIRDAGVTRVTGSVVGDRSAFRRDRGAPGWRPIALRFIGLPTALSFEHNVDAGGYVFDPERRAATELRTDLRRLGVQVEGGAAAGAAPDGVEPLARVRSAPLAEILRRQNVASDNLDAETLSKLLGARDGGPGSIRAGARVIEDWADDRGADVTLFDASGLSYRNDVTAGGLAMLLDAARDEPWGSAFAGTLPTPGQGTLGGRLGGLEVRAKTGTLIGDVSALSGYVRSGDGRWASFSILSRLPKAEAVALEDAIVRAIAANA